MNEWTEPPNSSVCSHSRNASNFGMHSFFTGIPEIQKKVWKFSTISFLPTKIRTRLTRTMLYGSTSTDLLLRRHWIAHSITGDGKRFSFWVFILDKVFTILGHCHEDAPPWRWPTACHTTYLQRSAQAFQRGGLAYVLLRANVARTSGFVGLTGSGRMPSNTAGRVVRRHWNEEGVVASWTSSGNFHPLKALPGRCIWLSQNSSSVMVDLCSTQLGNCYEGEW